MKCMDEFEIKATHPDMEERVWTRDTLGVSKFIADQAVDKLGYQRAAMVNIYGGHRSDELYVKGEKPMSEIEKKDRAWTATTAPDV